MSRPPYTNPLSEDWEDLIDWEDTFFQEPLFKKHTNVAARQPNGDLAYHVPGSIATEQSYTASLHPSLRVETSSYTASASPSIIDHPSSFSQAYCNSPSFSSAATSPLVGRDDARYFGSYGACDGLLPPLREDIEPSVLDTRSERIVDSPSEARTDAYRNPYGAISRMDVSTSAIFTQAGTWVDQPLIIEPIAECDEHLNDTVPSPGVQPQCHSFNSSSTSCPQPQGPDPTRSRAITIPRPNHKDASHNSARSHSQWSTTVPPILSVSPTTHRITRGAALSRSSSRTESRRKMATPSPTSSNSFSWVSYHVDRQTKKLAPTAAEGGQGRAMRGRKKALTADQRSQAALMRIVGACSNCQRRKEKCDPGTPCKSCLVHYKGDLVQHPCRDRLLSDLSKAFLSERLGWHPTARSLESCVAAHTFDISTGVTYTIPLIFGFGPSLRVPVHPVDLHGSQDLTHEHVIYNWPPTPSSSSTYLNAVLPAVLTEEAASTLAETLDLHLSHLVTNPIHFRSFPLFCSPLQILRHVYVFFCSLHTSSTHFSLLHRALKLLVLVHVGGDLTVPLPSEDGALARLVHLTTSLPPTAQPTPCLIRAQFGAVMPTLATHLMQSVLADLEQVLLARRPDEWPLALAVVLTVLMTLESIHYHATKTPYHAHLSPPTPSPPPPPPLPPVVDDPAVIKLLAFYTACFKACHARLRPAWSADPGPRPGQQRVAPEDAFVTSVRGAAAQAGAQGYLQRKAGEAWKREGGEAWKGEGGDNDGDGDGNGDGNNRSGEGDVGFCFDRLVARVLLV